MTILGGLSLGCALHHTSMAGSGGLKSIHFQPEMPQVAVPSVAPVPVEEIEEEGGE
jgi:hypothetical protein